MSITAYVGLPRSGKSYNVVKHVILPALSAGRLVVHNMVLDHDALLAEYPDGRLEKLPDGVTAADLVKLCPPGAVIVLDEIWRYWPAGMTAAKVEPEQQEFFTMHGHKVGMDGKTQEIALITQDLSQIANWIRVLVEQTYRHTKLTNVGSEKRFRVDIYGGFVTGQAPPQSKLIKQEFGTYEAAVWKYYKSHTMSVTGEAGVEQRADKRGNLLKGWKIKLAIGALCLIPVAIWGLVHSVTSFADQVSHGKGADAGAGLPAQQQTPMQPAAPSKPPAPQESSSWRFAGRIVVDGMERFLIEGVRGTRLLPPELCTRDPAENPVCMLDGQIIAAWTGPQPSFASNFTGSSDK